MGNKFKVFLGFIFFFTTCTLPAQINISVDRDCLERNSAIFSQLLIKLKGEMFVSNLLEDQVNLFLNCTVDPSGVIIEVDNIRSKKELSEEFKQEISSYLMLNPVPFYICFERLPDLSRDESLAHIKQYLLKEGRSKDFISIYFLGYLMNSYLYNLRKAKEEGRCLSKYEHIQTMINEYKSKPE